MLILKFNQRNDWSGRYWGHNTACLPITKEEFKQILIKNYKEKVDLQYYDSRNHTSIKLDKYNYIQIIIEETNNDNTDKFLYEINEIIEGYK